MKGKLVARMKELVRENIEQFAMLMLYSKPRRPPMYGGYLDSDNCCLNYCLNCCLNGSLHDAIISVLYLFV